MTIATCRIAGIDPGLAELGIVVLEIREGVPYLISSRLVETRKAKAKDRVHAVSDEMRRLEEICVAVEKELRTPPGKTKVSVVGMEEPPRLRHAASVRKVACAWGACYALTLGYGTVTVEVTPTEAKLAVTDSRKASKAEVEAGVLKNVLGWPDGLSEHECDAAAIALAALKHPLAKARLGI